MGIRPISRSWPLPLPTPAVAGPSSKTATALLSASATNSLAPSSDSASALGVLPSAGPAGAGSNRSVMTRPVRVSATLTRSVLPEATKSRVPAALRSSADGCRATGITRAAPSRPGPSVWKLRTSLPPHAETYTEPSAATTTVVSARVELQTVATMTAMAKAVPGSFIVVQGFGEWRRESGRLVIP